MHCEVRASLLRLRAVADAKDYLERIPLLGNPPDEAVEDLSKSRNRILLARRGRFCRV